MQRKEQTTRQDRREILLLKLRQLSNNYDQLLTAYDEILHETSYEIFEVEQKKARCLGGDNKETI